VRLVVRLGAGVPMLARQKRRSGYTGVLFREPGARLEESEQFARCRVCGRADDDRRVLHGFLCSRERAPFGLIDGLIWPKTRYASID
jgi:hypothetical protein